MYFSTVHVNFVTSELLWARNNKGCTFLLELTSIWCLCRKNMSLSCRLASWCFSCNCRSSISQMAASRALINCCFCCKNCLSNKAIFSLCVSPSLRKEVSCASFSFAMNVCSLRLWSFSMRSFLNFSSSLRRSCNKYQTCDKQFSSCGVPDVTLPSVRAPPRVSEASFLVWDSRGRLWAPFLVLLWSSSRSPWGQHAVVPLLCPPEAAVKINIS